MGAEDPAAANRADRPTPARPSAAGAARVRAPLAAGLAGLLVVLIMFLSSLGLWLAVPLLWLWVGSQVEGATDSVGAGFGVALPGAIVTIALVAVALTKLSAVYRANRTARGLADNGNVVLERALVISAGFAVLAFGVWFLFFAGASPVPLGLQV